MPEVEATHLVELWHNSGMYSNGGMGAAPLTWQELNSYCSLLSIELTEWEAAQIMTMSRSYVSWLRKGEDPMMPAPYTREETEEEIEARRAEVARQFAEIKAARREARKKKGAV